MMSNNKILTVSYGTFSCTLEGFDDSFGTMKAIAEYFRDLASDDRYFGAEPPQPDAEMLARIAEKEISRRVEAREQEGRIVLSAGNEDVAAPVAPPSSTVSTSAAALAPALAYAEQPQAPVVEESGTTSVYVDAPDQTATVGDAPEVEATASSIEEANADAPEVDQAGDIHAFADAQADEAPEPVETEIAEDMPTEAEEHDAIIPDSIEDSEEIEEQAEAFFADASDNTPEEDGSDDIVPVAEIDEPAEDDASDSIAAKLQRIRAVVSQSQNDAQDDELFEDEHAEDMETHDDADAEVLSAEEPAAEDIRAAVLSDLEDLQDAQDAMEEDAQGESDDDDIAAILARFDTDAQDDDTADAGIDAVADMAEAAESDAGDEDMGLDSLAALMAQDADQPADDEQAENLFDDSISAETEAEEDDAQDAVSLTDATEEEDAAPRRARIIKVKRADIDAALASGQLEELSDAAEEDADSTLSDAEEAELMAELAQVEAEMPTEAVSDDEPVEAAYDEDMAETVVLDDDVSRLMAEADTQMEEPEGSSRRSAFAHLKAAVMAKKADAGIGSDDQEDEGAFRSDLASVVKPRRPAAGGKRDKRPGEERPAPLKLVAEQRVDVDAAPKGPVRPRRVAAVEDVPAAGDEAGSFADYASDLGAHNLPDLLEAAASYLSFVEGRDQFSRPQLMTKVRQVEQGDFSREDGLRSFGQLLRAGKIEKIKGGRFAVTGDIGYRPDQRAAS